MNIKNSGKTAARRPDGMPEGKPFPKGTSGNSNGRPLGSRNIKTILRELLDMPTVVTDSEGNNHELTYLDAICAKLVKMAKEGDLASIDRVFDRLEGKAAQSLNLGGQGGDNPIVTRGELVVKLIPSKGSSNG